MKMPNGHCPSPFSTVITLIIIIIIIVVAVINIMFGGGISSGADNA